MGPFSRFALTCGLLVVAMAVAAQEVATGDAVGGLTFIDEVDVTVVNVDVFVPGCPPMAETIWFTVSELLAGRIPDLTGHTRFGV